MQEITKRNPLVSEASEPMWAHAASSLQTRRAFHRMVIAGLFAGSSVARGDDPSQETRSSKDPIHRQFVIGGGGFLPDKVHQEFVRRAGGEKAKVLVVPTASKEADVDKNVGSYWKWSQNVASARLLHTRSPMMANSQEFVDELDDATAIWWNGGDQNDLVAPYLRTKFHTALDKFVERGGVIGGSSAGASALSSIMIKGGNPVAELGEGLGLVPWAMIDQHHLTPGRIERLLRATKQHPQKLGFGIEDRTAAIVDWTIDTVTVTVMGEGKVRFCQNEQILKIAQDGDTINLVNLSIPHDESDRNALFRLK